MKLEHAHRRRNRRHGQRGRHSQRGAPQCTAPHFKPAGPGRSGQWARVTIALPAPDEDRIRVDWPARPLPAERTCRQSPAGRPTQGQRLQRIRSAAAHSAAVMSAR